MIFLRQKIVTQLKGEPNLPYRLVFAIVPSSSISSFQPDCTSAKYKARLKYSYIYNREIWGQSFPLHFYFTIKCENHTEYKIVWRIFHSCWNKSLFWCTETKMSLILTSLAVTRFFWSLSLPTHTYTHTSIYRLQSSFSIPYVSCLTLYLNMAIHFPLIHLLCNWIFTLYEYSLLHD